MAVDSCTHKVSNQKNGRRGVCINYHTNGESILCPVRAIGRRYAHITTNRYKHETFLLSYWIGDEKYMMLRSAPKATAVALHYPEMKRIHINMIDTHSLRGGGTNALSLSGYSDREIQKMGRCKSDTFKETPAINCQPSRME